MSSNSLMYVPGLERGVRPIGDWSIDDQLVEMLEALDAVVLARLALAVHELRKQRLGQDVVHQRALARCPKHR